MSKIEVNAVEPQCGTTLTLGASGDTITIPSGATITNNGTQTGFGRTGTVDWDTTKKTASFTAVNGTGYFIDTSGGAVTMTLPASPSAGDIVAFKDYAGTFATNNLTIGRNGSNLDGAAGDKAIDTNNTSMSLVYVDATQGWKSVEEGTGFIGEAFVTATGGTITTSGNFKIHTFTGPGNFTVNSLACSPANNVVDYLVVAGGGGGGMGNNAGGGGGGGGGYRESSGAASGCYTASPLGACVSALPVSVQGYPITVGAAGGGTGSAGNNGDQGSNSIFSTITSAGGGGGSGHDCTGTTGGSGGGGSGGGPRAPESGKAGNTPSVSPPQGNNGGAGSAGGPNVASGGGGGATAVGGTASNPGGGPAGPGGAGGTTNINGSPNSFSGGGGGGAWTAPGLPGGNGGVGGGGGGSKPISGEEGDGGAGFAAGGDASTLTGGSGGTNSGGGGGAGGGPGGSSGAGGSGIVIIRYKFQ